MADPIAYRRIYCVVQAFGKYPADDYGSVLSNLKKDSALKDEFRFRDRESGRMKFISDNAIKGWFNTARYWKLVQSDVGKLTEAGQGLYDGNFQNRFLAHLGDYVQTWNASLPNIIALLDGFNGQMTIGQR